MWIVWGAMWSESSLIAEAASLNTFEICFDMTCLMQPYFQMAEIGMLSLALRYNQIHQMMVAAAWTGHSVMSPEAIWVVVLFFLSFFCIYKVMLRQLLEHSRLGLL